MKRITSWILNHKISSVIITILTIAIIVLFTNFNKIVGVSTSFSSTIKDSDFVILNREGKDIRTIKTPTDVTLRSGDYYVRPVNTDKYSSVPIKISVKGSEVFDLEFDFSTKYYEENFANDRDIVVNMINQRYSKIISDNNFSIDKGFFFNKGEYYVVSIGLVGNIVQDTRQTTAVLKENVMIGEIYRVIFQKTDSGWKQVTHPELILSSVDYPNIPIDIIRQVNMWE
ncbi:MAG: hypothetical protein ACOX0Z_01195 [Candidatus Nanosyncoccaceae bacterium]|jgi:hypothetical protein